MQVTQARENIPRVEASLACQGQSDRGNWAPLNTFDVQGHLLPLTQLTAGTRATGCGSKQTWTQPKDSHSSAHCDIGNLTRRSWKPFGLPGFPLHHRDPGRSPHSSLSFCFHGPGLEPVLKRSTYTSRSRCAQYSENGRKKDQ